ncbi:MAG: KOW motif-containing protein [Nanoarchaeota archaeon]
MHQTRAKVTKKMPIPRKGTKYVARSLIDLENSVPVVVAVRDMLKFARTVKEVREMIKNKQLKINGKEVKDYRDSIRLFNLFEADKSYLLTLTPTGKFSLEETKSKERPCKVINKKVLKGRKVQLNLHDGSNILVPEKEKINTQDTVYLDLEGKLKKHLSFEKGKECLVIAGKFLGQTGKVESIENSKAKIRLKEKELETTLKKKGVIVL